MYAIYLIPQVIPDLDLGAFTATKKVTEEDQDALADYQAVFFDDAAAERREAGTQPQKRKRQSKGVPVNQEAPPVVRLQRKSAAMHITVLDKLLYSLLGVGLVVYVPAQNYFELAGKVLPWCLVLHMDEASPGYAMFWFLALHLKIRIVFIRDPYHRQWNDTRLALTRTGVWWICLVTIVAFNMPFAPYGSGAFGEQLKEAFRVLLARSDFNNPTFRALYALICKDMGREALGTEAHMRMIFEIVTAEDHLLRKGTFIAQRRWFDWVAAVFVQEKVWHSRLFSIILVGQLLGVYVDFRDVPLWSTGKKQPRHIDTPAWTPALDDAAAVQAAKQAADDVDEVARAPKKLQAKDDKAPVKPSASAELSELRKLTRNAFFLAGAVYGREGMYEQVKLIAYLCRPIWTDHSDHARNIRSPYATEHFYTRMALGDYFSVLNDTMALLQNVEILQKIGFVLDFHRVMPEDASSEDSFIVTQNELAAMAVDIVRNLCRERLASMLWHSGCWPGLLGMMTSGKPSYQKHCIEMLRSDFRAFLDAAASSDVVLRKMAFGSCFHMTLVREVAELVTRPLVG